MRAFLGSCARNIKIARKCIHLSYRDPAGNQLPRSVVDNITIFQKKQKKGTIDVWWLYDDGGNFSLITSDYRQFQFK